MALFVMFETVLVVNTHRQLLLIGLKWSPWALTRKIRNFRKLWKSFFFYFLQNISNGVTSLFRVIFYHSWRLKNQYETKKLKKCRQNHKYRKFCFWGVAKRGPEAKFSFVAKVLRKGGSVAKRGCCEKGYHRCIGLTISILTLSVP